MVAYLIKPLCCLRMSVVVGSIFICILALPLVASAGPKDFGSRIEQTKAESDNVPEVISPLSRFLSEGDLSLDERYRFEVVDQDGFSKTAKASTLRSRLEFLSGKVAELQTKIQIEDITEIGNDLYDSTVNGNSEYPVVADPDGTEINELWLSYFGIPDTVIRGGREALKLDNLRFIGDVGWRQNNQTYDGLNIVNKTVPDLTIFYGFIGNVNRIFGEDSPNGDFNTKLNLLNVKFSGIPYLDLTSYVYLLDVDSLPTASSGTFGGLAQGKRPVSDVVALTYEGEYAFQQDYQDNPLNYSAHYWRASLGVDVNHFVIQAGHESLGSDDGRVGFNTPFATLHAWNGWADKFLQTPENGLRDDFAKLSYSVNAIHRNLEELTAQVVYHYFSSDEFSTKYGDEWDFNLHARFSRFFSLGVKYALYDSAAFASDTEKLIFTAQFHLSK